MSHPHEEPARLHQINATYDPLEDRIRLLVSTTHGHEYRFWVTRRYMNILWQALGRITAHFAALHAPTNPLLQSALSDFSAAKAMNNADLKTPYAGGSEFPLGESPVLLSRITVGNAPHHQQLLRLQPEQGQGIDLTLNDELTHVLSNILRQAAAVAEWGLDVDAVTTIGLPDSGNQPLRLH
jgi:hypothetical protein